jgi:hypothetical protein
VATTPGKTYKRLPGTGYRRIIPGWAMVMLFFVIGIFVLLFRGRRIQLWLGDDHLLLVEWDGHREYYKRFRYGDIQAFMIRKTVEGRIANIVLGAITGMFAMFLLGTSDPVRKWILLAIGGISALILIASLLSGATCQCHLRTAVQTEELPSLTRLPRASKALDRLRPLIVAAQGQLMPEEIPARMRELVQSPEFNVQSPGPSGAVGPQP